MNVHEHLPGLWLRESARQYAAQTRIKLEASPNRGNILTTINQVYGGAFEALSKKAYELKSRGPLALDSAEAGAAVKAYLASPQIQPAFQKAVQAAFDVLKTQFVMVSDGAPNRAIARHKAETHPSLAHGS